MRQIAAQLAAFGARDPMCRRRVRPRNSPFDRVGAFGRLPLLPTAGTPMVLADDAAGRAREAPPQSTTHASVVQGIQADARRPATAPALRSKAWRRGKKAKTVDLTQPTRASGARCESRASDSAWLRNHLGLASSSPRPPRSPTSPHYRAHTLVEPESARNAEMACCPGTRPRGLKERWQVQWPGLHPILVSHWGGAVARSPIYAGPHRKIAPATPPMRPLVMGMGAVIPS